MDSSQFPAHARRHRTEPTQLFDVLRTRAVRYLTGTLLLDDTETGHVPRLFTGGAGEMETRVRNQDWAATALGPLEAWAPALRCGLELMLTCRQPMFMACGSKLNFLYNDAYAHLLGNKHPEALGRPFEDVWSDIWDQIGPLVVRTMSGEASWHDDFPITMRRHGYLEETWFSFSYTPLRDEAGKVIGIFCAVTETTNKVLAERQGVGDRERLRQMFQQAPGIMTMVRGPDHVLELANDAFFDLVGERDVIGKSAREAFPELQGQGFFELLDEVFRTGMPYIGSVVPVRLKRAREGAAEQRFIDFIYQPVKNADGAVTGIFTEGFDVTERVRAEEALRASEEFNRRILENSTDCIKVLDTAGQLRFMSEGGIRVMEVDDFGAVEGCDWRDFWSGPQQEDARAAVDSALAGKTARFQGPAPTFKGTPRWWDVVVTPMRSASGEVEKLLTVSRDITMIKQAEEALQESERRLNAVLDNASVAVFLMDEHQHCVYMNAAAEKLTGYTLAETLGRSLHSVIHHTRPDGSHYPIEDCPIDRAFPECHLTTGEDVFVHKDGTFYPVAFTASPIQDATSKVIGTIIEVRDIRIEKRSQEQQKILIAELNHRVKNTLATVQSIVAQTLRNEADPGLVRSSVEARLVMLSRAHDVLTRESWEGAALYEIIGEALAPYQSSDRNIVIHGPHTRLTPRMALALSMALHELATNAVKYGALSIPGGVIQVRWNLLGELAGTRLHLRWEESNGPAVTAPTRRGFGTRLIEGGLARDLDGEVRISFDPTGVVCELDVPLPGQPAQASAKMESG